MRKRFSRIGDGKNERSKSREGGGGGGDKTSARLRSFSSRITPLMGKEREREKQWPLQTHQQVRIA